VNVDVYMRKEDRIMSVEVRVAKVLMLLGLADVPQATLELDRISTVSYPPVPEPEVKRGRGRPPGSLNKPKDAA